MSSGRALKDAADMLLHEFDGECASIAEGRYWSEDDRVTAKREAAHETLRKLLCLLADRDE